MENLYDKKEAYENKIKKDLYDTEKKVKDAQKVRVGLEQEVKSLENQHQKESSEHFSNNQILDKGLQFGDLNGKRYQRDSAHVEGFLEMKTKVHQKVMEARDAAHADYMGRKDLQDQIQKMNDHLEGIEKDHVLLESLSIEIGILETNTNFLEEKKADLESENKQTIDHNETLEKQVKAS